MEVCRAKSVTVYPGRAARPKDAASWAGGVVVVGVVETVVDEVVHPVKISMTAATIEQNNIKEWCFIHDTENLVEDMCSSTFCLQIKFT